MNTDFRHYPMLFRAPQPEGWQVESVEIDGASAPLVEGDTVDLSERNEPLTVGFAVKRS